MPYRERVAWLTLAAMTVTFGPYFTIVALSSSPAGTANVRQLGVFAVAAIGQMLVLGVGHWYLSRRYAQDAGTPPDERDRAIMGLSLRSAYYVLIGGMIVVGCIMPFNSGGWSIINAALFMIVFAEAVHYGVVVLSYRRQA